MRRIKGGRKVRRLCASRFAIFSLCHLRANINNSKMRIFPKTKVWKTRVFPGIRSLSVATVQIGCNTEENSITNFLQRLFPHAAGGKILASFSFFRLQIKLTNVRVGRVDEIMQYFHRHERSVAHSCSYPVRALKERLSIIFIVFLKWKIIFTATGKMAELKSQINIIFP